jgi:HEAT repeat protein
MFLGATASDEARKALRRAAERDKDEHVRAAAQRALQDLGEPAPKPGS